MTNEIIFTINQNPDGEYEARALGYSIFTIAETKEELIEQNKDAIKCHFEPELMPKLVNLHFVYDEVFCLWNYQET